MDNDFSPVANSSCDNCCGSPVLTVHLPPVDVTCDPVSHKTRKARRKPAKDRHADNSGNPIKIRRKSGATLADIEQMIDDAAKTETSTKYSSLVVLTKKRVT